MTTIMNASKLDESISSVKIVNRKNADCRKVKAVEAEEAEDLVEVSVVVSSKLPAVRTKKTTKESNNRLLKTSKML